MKHMLLTTDIDKMVLLAPQMKRKIKSYQEPFLFLVDGEPTIIGEIEIRPEDIYIKMVESIEKGQGKGKEFIDYLKCFPDKPEIWGESVVPAIGFWRKMGADFNTTVYRHYEEIIRTGRELKEDFLIPFTIHN